MQEEVWKDIEGYEGVYQVSTYGRVKSLDRYILKSDGVTSFVKGRILVLAIDKDGYTRIGLCVSNIKKYVYIHRLVAQTFILNPNNLPKINHKDMSPNIKEGVPVNNYVENLEWCTNQYNNTYGNRLEKFSKTMRERKHINGGRTVYQYDLDYNLIKVWNTVLSIEKELGFCESSIRRCCYAKIKQCYGYIWSYDKLK